MELNLSLIENTRVHLLFPLAGHQTQRVLYCSLFLDIMHVSMNLSILLIDLPWSLNSSSYGSFCIYALVALTQDILCVHLPIILIYILRHITTLHFNYTSWVYPWSVLLWILSVRYPIMVGPHQLYYLFWAIIHITTFYIGLPHFLKYIK